MSNYSDNKKLLVINLHGGPGCGKSTTAARLFCLLNIMGYKVELVTEYAKDLVYSDRVKQLSEQDYLFAKQNQRLRRLVDKVDIVITDSSLINSIVYTPENFPSSFPLFVKEVYDSYTNINVLINRNHAYKNYGRVQNESEAVILHKKISQCLYDLGIKCTSFKTSDSIAQDIFNHLKTNSDFRNVPTIQTQSANAVIKRSINWIKNQYKSLF